MLLRVVVAPDDIRRLLIEDVPEALEDFQLILKTRLNLDGEFVIQYEDPDFQNELVNLTSPTELPNDKATLKIIQKMPPDQQLVIVSDSSTLDTASLSSASSSAGSPLERTKNWAEPFIIPVFSFDVELKLKRGNEAYVKDGSLLDVTKGLKSEILDRLVGEMFQIDPYPSQEQIEEVAKALVQKHPCLKEVGSAGGWYCWKFSLNFKVGNYRHKLRVAGCTAVLVNKTRRSEDGKMKRRIKKPRRSETNFLPELPDEDTCTSLEEDRKMLLVEIKKVNPNHRIIDAAMANTYAMRRKEIIEDEPLVSMIKSRWPALFTERQILAEFNRLMSADLLGTFLSGLDEYLPRFLDLFRKKNPAITKLQDILRWLDAHDSNQNKRTAVLLGMSHFLREDSSSILKTCEPTDPVEDLLKETSVGILIVSEESSRCVVPNEINDICLVLEEQLVVMDISNIPKAFGLMMGIIYVLNIDYPKHLKYTFEVLQKLFLNIGSSSCSSRVHGLRNRLLGKE